MLRIFIRMNAAGTVLSYSDLLLKDKLMDDYSYILFNKTPQQLRLIGAGGGKAYGRNQRARRALLPPQSTQRCIARRRV
jgi:hypothetical protein